LLLLLLLLLSVPATVAPCRNVTAVSCPCTHHTDEWACRIVNRPGWPASFPRFRVGGAPGRVATKTEKIELRPITTDERKRKTCGNGERYFFT